MKNSTQRKTEKVLKKMMESDAPIILSNLNDAYLDTDIEDLLNGEFKRMFTEYCLELTNAEAEVPCYEELEEQMRIFELNRGYELHFVRPDPGFVVLASVKGEYNLYINIASSDAISQAFCKTGKDPLTKRMLSIWDIPMAVSDPRLYVNAKGENCRVCDVVIHSLAMSMALCNVGFNSCIIDAAMEALFDEYNIEFDYGTILVPDVSSIGYLLPTVLRYSIESQYGSLDEDDDQSLHPLNVWVNALGKYERNVTQYEVEISRHDCFTIEPDKKLPTTLYVNIQIPTTTTTADWVVTPQAIYSLSGPANTAYCMKIGLPYVVDDVRSNVQFDVRVKILYFFLPVRHQQSIRNQFAVGASLFKVKRDDYKHLMAKIQSRNNAIEACDATPTYVFPICFECVTYETEMQFFLYTGAIVKGSITLRSHPKGLHLKFIANYENETTQHAFYLKLPVTLNSSVLYSELLCYTDLVQINICMVESKMMKFYWVGTDKAHLEEYNVVLNSALRYIVPRRSNDVPKDLETAYERRNAPHKILIFNEHLKHHKPEQKTKPTTKQLLRADKLNAKQTALEARQLKRKLALQQQLLFKNFTDMPSTTAQAAARQAQITK